MDNRKRRELENQLYMQKAMQMAQSQQAKRRQQILDAPKTVEKYYNRGKQLLNSGNRISSYGQRMDKVGQNLSKSNYKPIQNVGKNISK